MQQGEKILDPWKSLFSTVMQCFLSMARLGSAAASSSLKQTTCSSRLLKKIQSAFKIMSYFEKYYVSLLFTVNM